MRVAMIGATGLTGRVIVELAAPRHRLHLFGRRPSGFDVRETVAPAEEWPARLHGEPIDVGVSALGTTWRQAGSWPAFEAVDHAAVVGFARAVRASGARQFIAISSVGADAASANNYLALKGRAERDLQTLGFQRVDIFRPGLLRGARGRGRRLGERMGIIVSPFVNLFLRGRLDRFAAIDARTVAAAIANVIGQEGSGVRIHHNREIRALAGA